MACAAELANPMWREPWARQMRCTELMLMPIASAIMEPGKPMRAKLPVN
jgi:hypothetical protein